MNLGIGDGSEFNVPKAWPTDLIAIERFLPNSHSGHLKWREIEKNQYYMPGEVCDPIGREWFYVEGDQPRSDEELLGMYLISRSRGANLLLDVGSDQRGLIPDHYIDALMRLKCNIDKFFIAQNVTFYLYIFSNHSLLILIATSFACSTRIPVIRS
jgi:alpha-L-fucosidase